MAYGPRHIRPNQQVMVVASSWTPYAGYCLLCFVAVFEDDRVNTVTWGMVRVALKTYQAARLSCPVVYRPGDSSRSFVLALM